MNTRIQSLVVLPWLAIDLREIRVTFTRSPGPGGQNVNKVATAVRLRFDAKHSPSLPGDVKSRLVQLAGNRMTSDGVLIIRASRFRSQEKNREDATNRLTELIRQAARKPAVRKKAKLSPAFHQRRLDSKRRRGEIKRLRRGDDA